MATLGLTVNLPSLTLSGGVYNNELITPGVLIVSVTGVHAIHDQAALTTSPVNLNKGNIGTIGYCYFKNLDVTNAIQIGSDGTTFQILLKPSEFIVVRWNAANVSAKASAGTPSLEYLMVND